MLETIEKPRSSLLSIDYKSELNEEQLQAVSAPIDKPALVLAGAGSGKTRTLTYRVAWLMEQGIAPWNILLLTFTNKAANEMLERVEQLTGVQRHKFWGGTFHHLGQKILRMHGDRLGIENFFNILDAGDAEGLLSEVISDLDSKFLKNKENPKASVISEIISFSRNTFKSIKDVIELRCSYNGHLVDEIRNFADAYAKRKLKQQMLDYDDLLELCLRLLEMHQDVREAFQGRFKNILVDEYQDTNPLQARLINVLAYNHQIMAVGDDAQCIYTWRGADFANIMTFPQKHPGTVIYKIETNYRSTPEVLNFANSVLESQPANEGYRKKLKAVRKSKEKPYFVEAMDTRQQAQFILRRLQGLSGEGYRLSDIAVLYRAHYHSMDLQMELTRAGVPFQITSGVRFFDQAHIRDLISQLRFASNPLDEAAFNRFICLLPKVGPKTGKKILEMAKDLAKVKNKAIIQVLDEESIVKKIPEQARESWVDLVYTLQDVFSGIKEKKPVELVKIVVEGWYGDFLRNIYTNWRSRKDDLESMESFASRYDNISDMLAQLILLNSETSDRAIDSKEDNLRLTTVHQAKGLEFPVVFVIGLADNMFPLKRAIEEGNIEEERRLFYVAVTRAKDELYLSYPRVNSAGGPPELLRPSQFITEISTEVYKELQMR